MAFMGNEIIQSRVWLNPNPEPTPNWNYKYTFPITVFNAVRRDMNDADSETLTQAIDAIYDKLDSKQHILPAKPANNLVTYGGIAGAVGSIEISTLIPFDEQYQSDYKIPTEKAVGNLLRKYGVIDSDEEVTETSNIRVMWDRIVGRPTIHSELGNDNEGVMSQAAIQEMYQRLSGNIDQLREDLNNPALFTPLQNHINDTNNPHGVTPSQIGAVDKTEFDNHTADMANPHNVTAEQIGLGNVDNTSDEDKPISKSTRAALDQLNGLIGDITGIVGGIRYVTDVEYTQANGRLDVTYNDGSEVGVTIVTDGLIDEVIPDKVNHSLIFQELNGNQKSIDLREVIGQFLGYNGSHIRITITEANAIKAEIQAKSITSNEIRDGSIAGTSLADNTITGTKIKDLTVTTANLGNGVVTVDKIANGTITGGKIDTHTIQGKNLSTSSVPNVILGIGEADTDAVWTKVLPGMIGPGAVELGNIASGAVLGSNIADATISGSNIAYKTITGDNIKNGSMSGQELADDASFPGTPTLGNTPDYDSSGMEIVNAEWVRYTLDQHTIDAIPDRSVKGRHLFSSDVKDRVLAVTVTNEDPEYVQINSEMIQDNAVTSRAIDNESVTTEKIAYQAVTAERIADKGITSQNIGDGEVKSSNIFESDLPNAVLSVGDDAGHPLYSKVTTKMIASEAVTEETIADHSVSVNKLQNPDSDDLILTYREGRYAPEWAKVTSALIANRAITGDQLFTSPEPNMVLAVTEGNTSPVWTKLTSEMIGEITFDTTNLLPHSISHEKLQLKSVHSDNIAIGAVQTEHIADSAVTADKLFRPNSTGLVLGVGKEDENIGWVQIETSMLKDHLITPNKMWTSPESHRVLAAIRTGDTPDFIQLTEEFFKDHSINSRKLGFNLTLYGSPTITEHPNDGSNDHTIPSTAWVRNTIKEMMYNATDLIASWGNIPDQFLAVNKLESSSESNRVIAVKEAGSNPVYTQVTEGMIENGAVTSDKIDRSVSLLGSPSIEVRPPKVASDLNGNGDLIPDVQWVKTHVEEAIDEYNDELKRKLKCLQDTDPEELIQNSDELFVDDIPDERITDLIEGLVDINATRSVRFQGNELGGIDEEHLNAILEGTGECEGTGSISYGSQILQAIPINHIKQIIRGTYNMPDEKDGLLIKMDDVSTGESGSCCCGDHSNDEFRSFIVPIDPREISGVLNGGFEPEPAVMDIELEGISISRISESIIEEYCKAVEGWADPTSTATPWLIDNNLVIEFDDEQANPAIVITDDGTVEMITDDTEASEDIARYSFNENSDGQLVTTFDPKSETHIPLQVTGTMIGDKYLEPISIDRIRKIIRGEVNPESSGIVEVTYGINTEEDNEHEYKYIQAIPGNIAVKICDGTATPEHRNDLEDIDGHIVERIDTDVFLDQLDAGVEITEPSGVFTVRDRSFGPIDITRIEGIIRGTIEPTSVDKYDFSDFRFVPEKAELGRKTVITEYIDDRAVTGTQMFTSRFDNMILAVTEANTDPEWTKVTHDMIAPGTITEELFTPVNMGNRVLGVYKPNSTPKWVTISNGMLDDESVDNRVLADGSVNGTKIQDYSIGANKLKAEPMFTEDHIFDSAITSRKIQDLAITASKLAVGAVSTVNIRDKSITSSKLEDAIVLPKNVSIKNGDLDRATLRNITISAQAPVGCTTGEIWFQFV